MAAKDNLSEQLHGFMGDIGDVGVSIDHQGLLSLPTGHRFVTSNNFMQRAGHGKPFLSGDIYDEGGLVGNYYVDSDNYTPQLYNSRGDSVEVHPRAGSDVDRFVTESAERVIRTPSELSKMVDVTPRDAIAPQGHILFDEGERPRMFRITTDGSYEDSDS